MYVVYTFLLVFLSGQMGHGGWFTLAKKEIYTHIFQKQMIIVCEIVGFHLFATFEACLPACLQKLNRDEKTISATCHLPSSSIKFEVCVLNSNAEVGALSR